MARNIPVQVVDGRLTCNDCRQTLPVDQFCVNRARKCGYNSVCRPCWNKRSKTWRDANAGHVRGYQADWRSRNVEQIAEYDRRHHLKSLYGLTQCDYDAMLARQDGKCAACGSPDPGNRRYRRFLVDHDHATGAVRGLLCNPCNVSIGQVNDDVDRLMALAAYLLQYQDVLTLTNREN